MKKLLCFLGVMLVSVSVVHGQFLTWDRNTESNVVGYHVYRCEGIPCTVVKDAAHLLTGFLIPPSMNQSNLVPQVPAGQQVQVFFNYWGGYAVTAVAADGTESELSKEVCFLNYRNPQPC